MDGLWAQAMAMGRDFSTKGLLGTTPLSRACQDHLKDVYAVLAGGVLLSCVGAWIQMNVFRDVHPGLTGILAFAAMCNVLSPNKGKKREEQLASFAFFTALKGFTLGPVVGPLLGSRPDIVFTAAAGTLCVFACFSLAAAFAPRRSHLYLGGILGSAAMYLMLVNMCNIFFASQLAAEVSLYGWLLVFVGYCLFDTQVAIESFYGGNRDAVRHACQLYVDVVHLFMRILDLLLRKEQRKRR